MSLIKNKTFLSIYIPNYLEFSILFVLGILDTFFIALVEPKFVTVLGLTHSLLVIVFVTSQIIANITSSNLANSELTDWQKHYWINKTLLLTVLTGAIYVSIIMLLVPFLLKTVNLTNQYQQLNYPFILIILAGAIFVALRRGINAIFNIYSKAKINLYSSLIIVALNTILNLICYFLFFGKNNELYLLSIACSTLCSQMLVPLGLLGVMLYTKITSFSNLRELLSDKKSDWLIIKTGFIASLEAVSYTVMNYVFIATLSHLSQPAFVTRTMLIPWFQMVGALGAAWVGYTNRELAFCLNTNNLLKFKQTVSNLLRWAMLFTCCGLVVMLSIFSLVQVKLLPHLYNDQQALVILVIIIFFLSLVELFRVRNVLTLTGLRLLKYVSKSTTISIMSHIILLIGFFIIYHTYQQTNTLLSVALLLGLLASDELFRSICNYALLTGFLKRQQVMLKTG